MAALLMLLPVTSLAGFIAVEDGSTSRASTKIRADLIAAGAQFVLAFLVNVVNFFIHFVANSDFAAKSEYFA